MRKHCSVQSGKCKCSASLMIGETQRERERERAVKLYKFSREANQRPIRQSLQSHHHALIDPRFDEQSAEQEC